MPQLHLYVSKETEAEIRRRASARHMSVSRYLAQIVHGDLRTDWPAGYFDRIVGGWVGQRLSRPAEGAVEDRDKL